METTTNCGTQIRIDSLHIQNSVIINRRQPEGQNMNKRRNASSISGGIFLIGLGVLLITDWWWPGIMLVIGLSGGAELIFRDQIARGMHHPRGEQQQGRVALCFATQCG